MSIPNVQHSDKFSVTISNIPGYSDRVDNKDNMGLYDLYVKEVSFPQHNLDFVQSNFKGYSINQPVSKRNDNLGTFSITFKLSEGMKNWFYIYRWMKELREGINIDSEKFFRLNLIKEIKINFLDNQKRPQWIYNFSNCFISTLSNLTFTNGRDEEMTFTIDILYEDFDIVIGECND